MNKYVPFKMVQKGDLNLKSANSQAKKDAKKKLTQDLKNHMVGALIFAFSMIIALTWQDVVKKLIKMAQDRLGLNGKSVIIELVAGVIVTILAVIAIRGLSMVDTKDDD